MLSPSAGAVGCRCGRSCHEPCDVNVATFVIIIIVISFVIVIAIVILLVLVLGVIFVDLIVTALLTGGSSREVPLFVGRWLGRRVVSTSEISSSDGMMSALDAAGELSSVDPLPLREG